MDSEVLEIRRRSKNGNESAVPCPVIDELPFTHTSNATLRNSIPDKVVGIIGLSESRLFEAWYYSGYLVRDNNAVKSMILVNTIITGD